MPEPSNAALQKQLDRMRVRRAFRWSAVATLLVLTLHAVLATVDIHALTVQPRSALGLLGLLFAPLLHGGWNHVLSNSIAILLLGTLAGSVYRAPPCALCRGCGLAQDSVRGYWAHKANTISAPAASPMV